MSGHFEILNAWLAFESDCPGYTGTGVHTDTCAATALMAALRAGAYSDFYIFLEAVRAPTPLFFLFPPGAARTARKVVATLDLSTDITATSSPVCTPA